MHEYEYLDFLDRMHKNKPHTIAWDYYMGKLYDAEVQTNKENKDKKRTGRTSEVMSEKYGVGHTTIQRCSRLMKGVDYLVDLGLCDKYDVLYGDLKDIPKILLEKVWKVSRKTASEAFDFLKIGDYDNAKAILSNGGICGDTEPEPLYNVDDMLDEIRHAGDNLNFALNQSLVVMHSDVLKNKEARHRINGALLGIVDDVLGYVNLTES